MSVPPPEMSLFAIAGGQTLDLINSLLKNADNAKQALHQLADQWDATLTLEYGNPRFQFKDPNNLPAGWCVNTRGRSNPAVINYTFQEETKEGEEMRRTVGNLSGAMNLRHHFSEACARSCGTCRGPYEYSLEKIGHDYVVICPRSPDSRNGEIEHFMPPDCVPIPASEYFRMKEAAGLIPTPTVQPFKRPFSL